MLNRTQKILFAEKLMDLANLALAGLVIGQAINEKINWLGLFLGIICYTILLVAAYFLEKGVEE